MANTQVYNITIDEDRISADIGKSGDLVCDIVCRSNNNKFFFGYGSYCASENSDDVECICLFTEKEMLYRKKFEDADIDRAVLTDDGVVFFYTDEYDLISLYPDGKQNFKKHLGIEPNFIKLSSDYINIFGYDETDDTVLVFYNYEDKKLTRVQIPNIDCINDDGDEDIWLADSTTLFPLKRGYAIIYDDHQTCLLYDFQGNELEPTDEERQQAVKALREKELDKQAERERKNAEREAFLKKRQELSDMLLRKFGSNKRAAISFVEKENNVSKYQATTIVNNIYSKFSAEQIYEAQKQLLKESKLQFAEARADLKKQVKDGIQQNKKGGIRSLFSKK